MKISINEKYETRSGLRVTILSDNVPNTGRPVMGYITYEEGRNMAATWTSEGKVWEYGQQKHEHDLQLASAEECAPVSYRSGKYLVGGVANDKAVSKNPFFIGHLIKRTNGNGEVSHRFDPKETNESHNSQ